MIQYLLLCEIFVGNCIIQVGANAVVINYNKYGNVLFSWNEFERVREYIYYGYDDSKRLSF